MLALTMLMPAEKISKKTSIKQNTADKHQKRHVANPQKKQPPKSIKKNTDDTLKKKKVAIAKELGLVVATPNLPEVSILILSVAFV